MGRKLILLFLLVFLFSFVVAQPPFQESTATQRLDLQIPTQEVRQAGQDYTFVVHVFNSTNGALINASAVNCSFHMINSIGMHIFKSNMTVNPTGEDLTLDVLGGNFTAQDGFYNVLYYCASNGVGGFFNNAFLVTTSGVILDTSKSVIYSSFFFLLVIFFFINTMIISKLPSGNKKDDFGELISISKLKYLRMVLFLFGWILLIGIMFLASNLGYAYLGETLFADIFFILYRIMFMITPLIVIVWALWIIGQIASDKEIKTLWARGMSTEGI